MGATTLLYLRHRTAMTCYSTGLFRTILFTTQGSSRTCLSFTSSASSLSVRTYVSLSSPLLGSSNNSTLKNEDSASRRIGEATSQASEQPAHPRRAFVRGRAKRVVLSTQDATVSATAVPLSSLASSSKLAARQSSAGYQNASSGPVTSSPAPPLSTSADSVAHQRSTYQNSSFYGGSNQGRFAKEKVKRGEDGFADRGGHRCQNKGESAGQRQRNDSTNHNVRDRSKRVSRHHDRGDTRRQHQPRRYSEGAGNNPNDDRNSSTRASTARYASSPYSSSASQSSPQLPRAPRREDATAASVASYLLTLRRYSRSLAVGVDARRMAEKEAYQFLIFSLPSMLLQVAPEVSSAIPHDDEMTKTTKATAATDVTISTTTVPAGARATAVSSPCIEWTEALAESIIETTATCCIVLKEHVLYEEAARFLLFQYRRKQEQQQHEQQQQQQQQQQSPEQQGDHGSHHELKQSAQFSKPLVLRRVKEQARITASLIQVSHHQAQSEECYNFIAQSFLGPSVHKDDVSTTTTTTPTATGIKKEARARTVDRRNENILSVTEGDDTHNEGIRTAASANDEHLCRPSEEYLVTCLLPEMWCCLRSLSRVGEDHHAEEDSGAAVKPSSVDEQEAFSLLTSTMNKALNAHLVRRLGATTCSSGKPTKRKEQYSEGEGEALSDSDFFVFAISKRRGTPLVIEESCSASSGVLHDDVVLASAPLQRMPFGEFSHGGLARFIAGAEAASARFEEHRKEILAKREQKQQKQRRTAHAVNGGEEEVQLATSDVAASKSRFAFFAEQQMPTLPQNRQYARNFNVNLVLPVAHFCFRSSSSFFLLIAPGERCSQSSQQDDHETPSATMRQCCIEDVGFISTSSGSSSSSFREGGKPREASAPCGMAAAAAVTAARALCGLLQLAFAWLPFSLSFQISGVATVYMRALSYDYTKDCCTDVADDGNEEVRTVRKLDVTESRGKSCALSDYAFAYTLMQCVLWQNSTRETKDCVDRVERQLPNPFLSPQDAMLSLLTTVRAYVTNFSSSDMLALYWAMARLHDLIAIRSDIALQGTPPLDTMAVLGREKAGNGHARVTEDTAELNMPLLDARDCSKNELRKKNAVITQQFVTLTHLASALIVPGVKANRQTQIRIYRDYASFFLDKHRVSGVVLAPPPSSSSTAAASPVLLPDSSGGGWGDGGESLAVMQINNAEAPAEPTESQKRRNINSGDVIEDMGRHDKQSDATSKRRVALTTIPYHLLEKVSRRRNSRRPVSPQQMLRFMREARRVTGQHTWFAEVVPMWYCLYHNPTSLYWCESTQEFTSVLVSFAVAAATEDETAALMKTFFVDVGSGDTEEKEEGLLSSSIWRFIRRSLDALTYPGSISVREYHVAATSALDALRPRGVTCGHSYYDNDNDRFASSPPPPLLSQVVRQDSSLLFEADINATEKRKALLRNGARGDGNVTMESDSDRATKWRGSSGSTCAHHNEREAEEKEKELLVDHLYETRRDQHMRLNCCEIAHILVSLESRQYADASDFYISRSFVRCSYVLLREAAQHAGVSVWCSPAPAIKQNDALLSPLLGLYVAVLSHLHGSATGECAHHRHCSTINFIRPPSSYLKALTQFSDACESILTHHIKSICSSRVDENPSIITRGGEDGAHARRRRRDEEEWGEDEKAASRLAGVLFPLPSHTYMTDIELFTYAADLALLLQRSAPDCDGGEEDHHGAAIPLRVVPRRLYSPLKACIASFAAQVAGGMDARELALCLGDIIDRNAVAGGASSIAGANSKGKVVPPWFLARLPVEARLLTTEALAYPSIYWHCFPLFFSAPALLLPAGCSREGGKKEDDDAAPAPAVAVVPCDARKHGFDISSTVVGLFGRPLWSDFSRVINAQARTSHVRDMIQRTATSLTDLSWVARQLIRTNQLCTTTAMTTSVIDSVEDRKNMEKSCSGDRDDDVHDLAALLLEHLGRLVRASAELDFTTCPIFAYEIVEWLSLWILASSSRARSSSSPSSLSSGALTDLGSTGGSAATAFVCDDILQRSLSLFLSTKAGTKVLHAALMCTTSDGTNTVMGHAALKPINVRTLFAMLYAFPAVAWKFNARTCEASRDVCGDGTTDMKETSSEYFSFQRRSKGKALQSSTSSMASGMKAATAEDVLTRVLIPLARVAMMEKKEADAVVVINAIVMCVDAVAPHLTTTTAIEFASAFRAGSSVLGSHIALTKSAPVEHDVSPNLILELLITLQSLQGPRPGVTTTAATTEDVTAEGSTTAIAGDMKRLLRNLKKILSDSLTYAWFAVQFSIDVQLLSTAFTLPTVVVDAPLRGQISRILAYFLFGEMLKAREQVAQYQRHTQQQQQQQQQMQQSTLEGPVATRGGGGGVPGGDGSDSELRRLDSTFPSACAVASALEVEVLYVDAFYECRMQNHKIWSFLSPLLVGFRGLPSSSGTMENQCSIGVSAAGTAAIMEKNSISGISSHTTTSRTVVAATRADLPKSARCLTVDVWRTLLLPPFSLYRNSFFFSENYIKFVEQQLPSRHVRESEEEQTARLLHRCSSGGRAEGEDRDSLYTSSAMLGKAKEWRVDLLKNRLCRSHPGLTIGLSLSAQQVLALRKQLGPFSFLSVALHIVTAYTQYTTFAERQCLRALHALNFYTNTQDHCTHTCTARNVADGTGEVTSAARHGLSWLDVPSSSDTVLPSLATSYLANPPSVFVSSQLCDVDEVEVEEEEEGEINHQGGATNDYPNLRFCDVLVMKAAGSSPLCSADTLRCYSEGLSQVNILSHSCLRAWLTIAWHVLFEASSSHTKLALLLQEEAEACAAAGAGGLRDHPRHHSEKQGNDFDSSGEAEGDIPADVTTLEENSALTIEEEDYDEEGRSPQSCKATTAGEASSSSLRSRAQAVTLNVQEIVGFIRILEALQPVLWTQKRHQWSDHHGQDVIRDEVEEDHGAALGERAGGKQAAKGAGARHPRDLELDDFPKMLLGVLTSIQETISSSSDSARNITCPLLRLTGLSATLDTWRYHQRTQHHTEACEMEYSEEAALAVQRLHMRRDLFSVRKQKCNGLGDEEDDDWVNDFDHELLDTVAVNSSPPSEADVREKEWRDRWTETLNRAALGCILPLSLLPSSSTSSIVTSSLSLPSTEVRDLEVQIRKRVALLLPDDISPLIRAIIKSHQGSSFLSFTRQPDREEAEHKDDEKCGRHCRLTCGRSETEPEIVTVLRVLVDTLTELLPSAKGGSIVDIVNTLVAFIIEDHLLPRSLQSNIRRLLASVPVLAANDPQRFSVAELMHLFTCLHCPTMGLSAAAAPHTTALAKPLPSFVCLTSRDDATPEHQYWSLVAPVRPTSSKQRVVFKDSLVSAASAGYVLESLELSVKVESRTMAKREVQEALLCGPEAVWRKWCDACGENTLAATKADLFALLTLVEATCE